MCDIFQCGVMLLRPSKKLFLTLRDALREKGDVDEVEFFNLNILEWKPLPMSMNFDACLAKGSSEAFLSFIQIVNMKACKEIVSSFEPGEREKITSFDDIMAFYAFLRDQLDAYFDESHYVYDSDSDIESVWSDEENDLTDPSVLSESSFAIGMENALAIQSPPNMTKLFKIFVPHTATLHMPEFVFGLPGPHQKLALWLENMRTLPSKQQDTYTLPLTEAQQSWRQTKSSGIKFFGTYAINVSLNFFFIISVLKNVF